MRIGITQNRRGGETKVTCESRFGKLVLPHSSTQVSVQKTDAKLGHRATVLRSGPYRFYFYSHGPNEPSHVHVDRDDLSAKFWLDPVGLARNLGFSAREVNTLQSIVQANQRGLLEAWDGYFGSRGR